MLKNGKTVSVSLLTIQVMSAEVNVCIVCVCVCVRALERVGGQMGGVAEGCTRGSNKMLTSFKILTYR